MVHASIKKNIWTYILTTLIKFWIYMTVSGKLGIAIRKITAILAINDKLFKITTFKFSEIDKKTYGDSIFSNFVTLKPSPLQKRNKLPWKWYFSKALESCFSVQMTCIFEILIVVKSKNVQPIYRKLNFTFSYIVL